MSNALVTCFSERGDVHDDSAGEVALGHAALGGSPVDVGLAFGGILVADVTHAFAAVDSDVFVVERVDEVLFREIAEIQAPHEFELDAEVGRRLFLDEFLRTRRRNRERQRLRRRRSHATRQFRHY